MATQDIDPSYFNNLDPDFLGNPDLLISVANWADLLVAPRHEHVSHPHDGIENRPHYRPPSPEPPVVGPDSSGPNRSEPVPDDDNRPLDLPLTDVGLNTFFDGARRLTGQGLNDIEHMFNVVTNDWTELGSHIVASGGGDPNSFEAAMNTMFNSWKGQAAGECAGYVAAIVDYIADEQKRVSGLADSLAAYAGIIKNARRSIVNLMRGFVAAMANQMSADVKAEQTANAQFLTGAAAQIISSAVSVVLGFPVKAVDAAKTLIGIAISLTDKAMEQSEAKHDAMSGGYAQIARTYLAEVERIIQEAQDALVEKYAQLRTIFNEMHNQGQDGQLNVPKPLFTTQQFDANGHRVMAGSA